MKRYIAIDGGTTNTRLNFVQDGVILETVRLSYGSNPRGHEHLAASCKEAIAALIGKYGRPAAILGCGMLTSEFGLFEVRHLPAPAGICEFHRGIVKTLLPEICDVPFYFIPGIKRAEGDFLSTDMMRGEETELIGLVDALSPDCAYILPGSHSKIIQVDECGRITVLRTFLTGEMTAALSQNTLLSSCVDLTSPLNDEMLLAGYRFALANGLNEALLKVRILHTQFGGKPDETYSFFLGAVLSGEIREIARLAEKKIVFGGQSKLKEASVRLLRQICEKELLPLDDAASSCASVFGMIKIFEYEDN